MFGCDDKPAVVAGRAGGLLASLYGGGGSCGVWFEDDIFVVWFIIG